MTETHAPETFSASYTSINDALFKECNLNNDVDFTEDSALLTIYPALPDSPSTGIEVHATFSFDANGAEDIYSDDFIITLTAAERVAEDHEEEEWNEREVSIEGVKTLNEFLVMVIKNMVPSV